MKRRITEQPAAFYASNDDDSDASTELAGFTEEEHSSDEEYEIKRLKTSPRGKATTTTKSSLRRKPTRKPDPNVCNRNALMARENRKKKKEHLESVEQENEKLQQKIKALEKTIKRQEVIVKGLRNERNYLKSVVANQPEIVGILRKLNREESGAKNEVNASPASNYSDYSSLAGDLSPKLSNGTVYEDPFLIDEAFLNSSLFSTDFLLDPTEKLPNFMEFEDDLDNNNFNDWSLPAEDQELQSKDPAKQDGKVENRVITSEHNYFHSNFVIPHEQRTTTPKPGVCLHINGGKVSLEFCSKCHTSATDEWRTKQLIN